MIFCFTIFCRCAKQTIVNSKHGLDLLYYPTFLSMQRATETFQKLQREIVYLPPEKTKVKYFGRWFDPPRDVAVFGEPGASYRFSGTTYHACPWPPTVLDLRNQIHRNTNVKYNYVVVNRYKDGSQKLGLHMDAETSLDTSAPIASISLGAVRTFLLKHITGAAHHVKIKLAHGSLLLMNPPTNELWLHSVPLQPGKIGPQINLTFRKIKM